MSEPFWAICYHTNSHSPHIRRWYYIARVIEADGMLFELYWLPEHQVQRGSNFNDIRTRALDAGLLIASGVYTQRFGRLRGPTVGGLQLYKAKS